MQKKNSAVKIISNMIFISLLGKILGLIREILFAKNFGTADISGTAFNYASNIPNQFLDIMFASAINSSFIPIFNHELAKKNKNSAFDLLNNFLSIIILISSLTTFFIIIGSGTEYYKIDNYINNSKPNNIKLINKLSPTISTLFIIPVVKSPAYVHVIVPLLISVHL